MTDTSEKILQTAIEPRYPEKDFVVSKMSVESLKLKLNRVSEMIDGMEKPYKELMGEFLDEVRLGDPIYNARMRLENALKEEDDLSVNGGPTKKNEDLSIYVEVLSSGAMFQDELNKAIAERGSDELKKLHNRWSLFNNYRMTIESLIVLPEEEMTKD